MKLKKVAGYGLIILGSPGLITIPLTDLVEWTTLESIIFRIGTPFMEVFLKGMEFIQNDSRKK